jgi:aldehyde dehydrogenase (NAD+)
MIQNIPDIVQELRGGVNFYRNTSAAYRIACLTQLEKVVLREKEHIIQALKSDFNKPELETIFTDIYVVVNEIRYARKKLKKWMSPANAGFKVSAIGSKFYSYPESKGVVLIFSTWNYPFNLGLIPLINAVAAGNTVLLKPSEYSPASSALIKKMVDEVFETNHVQVVLGGVEIGTNLLKERYNHIMFTGSLKVAKIVMAKAAETCTPVTLELGGKNPAVVFADANLKAAAQRIIWGKWMNAGQTCIGVDMLIVEEKIKQEFIQILLEQIKSSEVSANIAAVIHPNAFTRQVAIVENALKGGANSLTEPEFDKEKNSISPVVLDGVKDEMLVMKEEIFGPILPISTFHNREDLPDLCSKVGDPLCVYVFSSSRKNQEYVLRNISSGAVGINDLIGQFFHPALPFGGVNQSGMGKSHGKWGFDEFSQYKAVIKNGFSWNWQLLAIQPYSDFKKKIANIVLRWF